MAFEKVDFEFQTSHQNPQVDCIHALSKRFDFKGATAIN